MSLLFSLGHPWLIYLPWASSALLLTLYSHGLLLTLLGSPTQLLHTHSWGLWAYHQSPTLFACIALGLPWPIFTSFSHHTLPIGLLLTISLFLSSFKPICFLKTHLLISWTYDPLFLPLGLNGFCPLSFANFFMLLGWASFLTFGFHKKDPQQYLTCIKNNTYV